MYKKPHISHLHKSMYEALNLVNSLNEKIMSCGNGGACE